MSRSAIEQVPGLDEADLCRLASHLEFVAASRPGMRGMKGKVDAIPTEDRIPIGGFLIALAAADGVIRREEVTALEKVFGYLGLDEADVYRLVHGLAIDDPGPVTVREAHPTDRWAVPDICPPAPPPSVVLDPATVRARLAETARVAELLTDIFVDDDTPSRMEPLPNGSIPESMIQSLDEPHSALLRALAVRPEWDRQAVEDIAESLGLPFLDGALDVVNEAAMDACASRLSRAMILWYSIPTLWRN